MNFYEELINTLKKNEEYVSEDNTLLKNKIIEDSMKLDENLINLLFNNKTLRERLFEKVGENYIFDKVEYSWLINNREFLPDSYTSFKNKIGLSTGNQFINKNEDVVLSFPFKDCILEGGQSFEDQKREEVFYNEIISKDQITNLMSPKVITNIKRFSEDKEEKNVKINEKDNLIIKGNNLLVISSLLTRFEGKINCIYIDPPFNTGNDSFNYNDKFTRSTWLVFMKNRLEVAKRLLTQTGNIFIHIDINQSHYLKVLADEIFGEENFVEELIWAYGSPSGGRAATPKPVNIHDYILHYARNYSNRKQNRVYIPYTEKYINDWFKYTDEDGRRYQRRQRGKDENGNAIWSKQYLDESKGVPLSTVWNDIQQVYADPRAYKQGNTADVEVIKEFSGGQKPEALISRILEMSTDEGDIVLDFHLGTGTTAAVAHKMGRQYIGVEQMDSQIDIILKRLQKVIKGESAGISRKVEWEGGGSFVYCELKEYSSESIRKVKESNDTKQLIQIFNEIKDLPFVNYRVDVREIENNIDAFKELSLDEQKELIIGIIDKNMLYVNYSDIDDENYKISDEDKLINKDFYEGV